MHLLLSFFCLKCSFYAILLANIFLTPFLSHLFTVFLVQRKKGYKVAMGLDLQPDGLTAGRKKERKNE